MAGAEIIKHQTHLAEFEMSEEAKKIIPVHTKDNIFKIISDCSLSEGDEIKLKQYIQKKKMIFISTPFSREASNRLNKMKVPAFKIGSGECNNYPLIEHICKFNKPNWSTLTSSAEAGEVVPIPTRPELAILTLSALLVLNNIGSFS